MLEDVEEEYQRLLDKEDEDESKKDMLDLLGEFSGQKGEDLDLRYDEEEEETPGADPENSGTEAPKYDRDEYLERLELSRIEMMENEKA